MTQRQPWLLTLRKPLSHSEHERKSQVLNATSLFGLTEGAGALFAMEKRSNLLHDVFFVFFC